MTVTFKNAGFQDSQPNLSLYVLGDDLSEIENLHRDIGILGLPQNTTPNDQMDQPIGAVGILSKFGR